MEKIWIFNRNGEGKRANRKMCTIRLLFIQKATASNGHRALPTANAIIIATRNGKTSAARQVLSGEFRLKNRSATSTFFNQRWAKACVLHRPLISSKLVLDFIYLNLHSMCKGPKLLVQLLLYQMMCWMCLRWLNPPNNAFLFFAFSSNRPILIPIWMHLNAWLVENILPKEGQIQNGREAEMLISISSDVWCVVCAWGRVGGRWDAMAKWPIIK